MSDSQTRTLFRGTCRCGHAVERWLWTRRETGGKGAKRRVACRACGRTVYCSNPNIDETDHGDPDWLRDWDRVIDFATPPREVDA